MKKIFIVAGAVVVVVLVVVAGRTRQSAAEFDFGDAPQTYAEASAQDTGTVWLGDGVDVEKQSKFTDLDQFDDGAELDVSDGANAATLYATVHKASSNTPGTAYVNAWFDWNKNGKWEKDEWAIQNASVDLAAQKEITQLYTFSITAPNPLQKSALPWYRVTITLNEQASGEDGGGSYKAGEIEDYGPPGKLNSDTPYKLFCSPAVLKLAHGESGTMGIAGFGFLSLANSVVPKNSERVIAVVPANPAGTSVISYHSIHIHDRDPVIELESVPIRVDIYNSKNEKIASRIKYCPVAITHARSSTVVLPPLDSSAPTSAPPVIETQPKAGGLIKTPSFDSNYSKETTGNTTALSVSITPQDLAGQKITTIEIPLQSRNYTLPVPSSMSVNLNAAGWTNDWKCAAGTAVRCAGKTPLETGKKTTIVMESGVSITPPAYIQANLYNDAGQKIVGIGIQFKPTN